MGIGPVKQRLSERGLSASHAIKINAGATKINAGATHSTPERVGAGRRRNLRKRKRFASRPACDLTQAA
jgi:hypothetical protein